MKITATLSLCLAALLAAALEITPCFGQETTRVYLSGRDKDDAVPWRFMCTTGEKSSEWTTLPVPSNWEMYGFGTLNYKKDVGSALEERGLYEHRFFAEPMSPGWRVFLLFEGVMTDTSVKLNGRIVGPTHQGGYYRFKYEVTDLVKWGEENLLEVEVAKHSANPSVNKAERTADYWVFGGIYRPVYLEIVPERFIERVAIDARADGAFAADVYVNGEPGDLESVTVEAQVQTLGGKPVGEPFAASLESEGPTRVSAQLDSPLQWSAEAPNLYQVEFRLKQGDEVLHYVRRRFGFRTVEVRRDDGIYVNGRRVVLKGVNRHSTWPDSGRCLSRDVHLLDIETIKGMNMNAVRMSHYPPDQEFLDLCDELGLYVLDELAGWHWHYDTHVGRKLVEEMVERDVNHPSVLFWDNGNEGGHNVSLDEVFGWFDPQGRTVLHPWEAYKFTNTAHYLEYDRAIAASQGAPTRHGPGENYQEWEDLNDPNKYIYMPTEMLHGLYDGGGGAGLRDYWELMRKSPVLGGGFMWVLFDEGIRRPDGTIDCERNQAPDGLVGPYREREGSFYTVKELWSPIQVRRGEGGRLLVRNDYSFTNADQCRLTWQLRTFRRPDEAEAGCTVVAEGERALPSIAPGESGEVMLNLPQPGRRVDALSVRIDDPEGRELWTWVWPLHETPAERLLPADDGGPVAVVEKGDAIVVEAGELRVEFNKGTGLLRGVSRGDRQFSLTNGPVATTGESKLESITHRMESGNAVVEAAYSGAMRSVKWTVLPGGRVDCEYEYVAEGELEYLGVTFDYPGDKVEGKRWLGDGPFRVWKNRRDGVTLGVWQNEYNDTITGYSGWEYPEFKGCFSGVRWMQLETGEGLVTIVPHGHDGFVQVLTPSQPPEDLRGMTSYRLPECGVALLDGIPPVGSKFKPADSTGPAGQLNQGSGVRRGAVSFWFGDLSPRQ